MAVRRSQNWINQQRVDVPHLRSIESAVRNDFDELLSGLILGEDKSYVVRGMEIEMAGAIGAAANGLQLIVADSSILHGKSAEAGTFFNIASGTNNETLSSTTNTRVEGAFTPSALNYVSVEFVRQVDDSTISQVYLWNPTVSTEITKTIPLAETLDYKIVISSSLFSSEVLPIAIVETDASNNVLNVQDRRNMLFRLGTAGSATPDPFYEYPWTNHAEGRAENHWQSANSTISPFRGGDKQITTFKENDEALKTELKQIKGTTYWYSPNSAGSIVGLRYDLGNTIMTGRGSVTHDNGNAGQMNWDQDIFLTVVATRLKYKLEANVATTDIDLDDGQCAYVTLIRGVDVIPQLIFTNGSSVVSSVGAIAWTASLEAGDYVKVGSEGDSSYYQILSVDSTSQVTLTENFGGTSTGINGTDAKIAYGVYRTDAAPSTDRHIKTANIEDVPFNADTYWLMFRSDSGGIPRIYIRWLNAELEQGEQIQISDQVPAAVLAYMGSSSDSDADPNYATSATGTKNTQTNYNSVQGENLTVRASKLTSMMADKAQDKTVQLVSNHTIVTNTTNAANQDITFSGGSGTATVVMPSSANNGTIGLSGTLSLAANQVAYYQVDRNAVFSLANLAALTVANIDSAPLDENTFVFAYRLAGNTVYLWNNQVLETGSSIDISVLRGYVQQNKTVKLVKGGTWSWDSVANELKNSTSAYIQVAGLAENVNEISAQTISLTADGQCAYVSLKRTAGASTLTVNVASISSVPSDDNTFIIARRVGSDVIVGTNSFLLKTGEFLELDGALAEINRYHGQLLVTPEDTISNRVKISGSDIAKLNGSKLSLEQNDLLLSFDGVVINFETGVVYESDGITQFLGGANNFTPFAIGSGEYFYYSITLLPNTINADNTISAQISVLPASASNAVLANAPKANFNSSGIKLASVYVQESGGGGGIANIDYANIVTLGTGGGSGGSTGSGRINHIENSTFESSVSGVNVYADAAATSPVDGTGGSANVTVTQNVVTPLRDTADAKLSKDAVNRQGQGWSIDLSVDNKDLYSTQRISFDYRTTANYVDGYARVFVYDVDNSALIGTSKIDIPANQLNNNFIAEFQATDSVNYRLIIHVASTDATAWDIFIDNVFCGPGEYSVGSIVSDWEAFTPTGSLSTNLTYSGFRRRVGDTLECVVYGLFSGTNTEGAFTLDVPGGLSIDTTKAFIIDNQSILGTATIKDSTGGSTGQMDGIVRYNSPTKLEINVVDDSSGSNHYLQNFDTSAGNPFTIANDDSFQMRFSIPIAGWGGNGTISSVFGNRNISMNAMVNTGSHTSSGSWQDLPAYSSAYKDTVNAFTTSSGVYKILESGWYTLFASATLSFNSAGTAIGVRFNIGGTPKGEQIRTQDTSSGGITPCVQTMYHDYFEEGTEIKVQAYQNSGGSLSYLASNYRTFLHVGKQQSPQSLYGGERVWAKYYTGSGQSIPNASYEKINFETKDVDSHNAVTVGASWQFKAPRTDIYRVSTQHEYATSNNWSAGNVAALVLNKGASQYQKLTFKSMQATIGNFLMSLNGVCFIYLLEGETISVSTYQSTGSALSISITTTPLVNTIEIESI